MTPEALQKNIRQGNSGVLYKWIVGNADKYPELDLTSIIKLGFKMKRSTYGFKGGRTIPERALKLLRKFPDRVDPMVVKDIIVRGYDLGILTNFMLNHPTLVTTEDLEICAKGMGETHGLYNYEEHIKGFLNKIETQYPMLKNTPIWNAFVTAELVNS
jgi:hypothetical protein